MKKQLFLMSCLCLIFIGCNNTVNLPGSQNQGGSSQESHPLSEEDRMMTQKIRQALTDDNTLSPQAKNIKIITSKGVVTLRGIVKNNQEKTLIGNKAKSIPNVKNVNNQIEVIAVEAR